MENININKNRIRHFWNEKNIQEKELKILIIQI